MATIEERVIRVIKESADDHEVKIDSTFEELEFDSLSAIEILFEVEEEFDITISNEAAKEVRTVRDVVTGVTRVLSGELTSAKKS